MTSTTLPRRSLVDAVASSCHGDFVRVELSENDLTVVGSDLTVTTSTTVRCKLRCDHDVGDETCRICLGFAVTLPTALLQKTCKALPDGDVEIVVSPSSLRLSCGSFRGDVAAAGRVPPLPAVPEERWRDVGGANALELAAALRAVLPAARDDAAQPTVSGVRLEVEGDALHVVATDGARLHRRDVVLVARIWAASTTLPRSGVVAVAEVLELAAMAASTKPKKGKPAEPPPAPPIISIALGARTVAVRTAHQDGTLRLVFCRRAPEPFCEWRRIAEEIEAAAMLRLARDVLIAALKQCPADAVTLTATPSGLRFDYVVTDDTGTRRLGGGGLEVTATTVVTVSPAPAVKVQTRYLLDALAGCGDDVELSITTAKPLRLRSGSFVAVVMWMR